MSAKTPVNMIPANSKREFSWSETGKSNLCDILRMSDHPASFNEKEIDEENPD
jgi:hypothetical protein